MGAASKRKGVTGEREFLQHLKSHGIQAKRNNQMFIGGVDNPDINAQIGGHEIHFEVKRTERFRLYQALDQAQRDANGHRMPVIAHRMNRRPWVVVLTFEDFLKLTSGNTGLEELPSLDDMDMDFSDLEKQLDNMTFEDF